jgi:hypothetical protein
MKKSKQNLTKWYSYTSSNCFIFTQQITCFSPYVHPLFLYFSLNCLIQSFLVYFCITVKLDPIFSYNSFSFRTFLLEYEAYCLEKKNKKNPTNSIFHVQLPRHIASTLCIFDHFLSQLSSSIYQHSIVNYLFFVLETFSKWRIQKYKYNHPFHDEVNVNIIAKMSWWY